eukprot:4566684-Prymnesium_polylepis.2
MNPKPLTKRTKRSTKSFIIQAVVTSMDTRKPNASSALSVPISLRRRRRMVTDLSAGSGTPTPTVTKTARATRTSRIL